MALWSDAPPEPRTRDANYPTLLFSWWCTLFAACIILFRCFGRKVRTDILFREDKIILYSLIPLFIRMGLVHVILIYGTNNVNATGLTATQIYHRSIGARLVLAARIFYAMFIWISKWTVSEFLKRIFYNSWNKTYETILRFIRVFLAVTFIAVVIATLSECQPFHKYWQVVPDPGPQCRQGFAQLITMGTADIITDILLVAFPIPLIVRSNLRFFHKFNLIVLFSFSLVLIAITAFRVPKVIEHRGRQQYRTVWASTEILVSALVSNMVVVGSFLADKGLKKNKYKATSGANENSMERTTIRRPTIASIDSDEDLFRSIGCRIPTELAEDGDSTTPLHPAPVFLPRDPEKGEMTATEMQETRYLRPLADGTYEEREETRHLAAFLRDTAVTDFPDLPPVASRLDHLNFSDAGGLLGPAESTAPERGRPAATHTTRAQDFAMSPPKSRGLLSSMHLNPSRLSMSKLGGGRASPLSRSPTRTPQPPGSPLAKPQKPSDAMDLQDIGGLLR